MRIHNLYVDEQGETHFRDVHIDWVHEGPGGHLSKAVAGKPRHSIFIPIE